MKSRKMLNRSVVISHLKQQLADLDREIDILERQANLLRLSLGKERRKHQESDIVPSEEIICGNPSIEERWLDGIVLIH